MLEVKIIIIHSIHVECFLMNRLYICPMVHCADLRGMPSVVVRRMQGVVVTQPLK